MAAITVIAEDLLAVVSAVHDVVTRFIGPRLPTRGATLDSPSVRFGARFSDRKPIFPASHGI